MSVSAFTHWVIKWTLASYSFSLYGKSSRAHSNPQIDGCSLRQKLCPKQSPKLLGRKAAFFKNRDNQNLGNSEGKKGLIFSTVCRVRQNFSQEIAGLERRIAFYRKLTFHLNRRVWNTGSIHTRTCTLRLKLRFGTPLHTLKTDLSISCLPIPFYFVSSYLHCYKLGLEYIIKCQVNDPRSFDNSIVKQSSYILGKLIIYNWAFGKAVHFKCCISVAAWSIG